MNWQPIETAPKDGVFLVYMPGEYIKFQVARFTARSKVIGGAFAFAFDLTAPSHWMPLPPPPDTFCAEHSTDPRFSQWEAAKP